MNMFTEREDTLYWSPLLLIYSTKHTEIWMIIKSLKSGKIKKVKKEDHIQINL